MTQPIFGNYRGYYSKRPSVNDPRLALLDPRIFAGAVVLDIGCNEGQVTCEIAQQWHAKKVIGVDIDRELVLAAWRRRRTVWSAQARTSRTSTKRKREDVDVDVESGSNAIRPDHFPLALAHMYGPLPIPSSNAITDTEFPHNVVFRTANWATTDIPEDATGYDVVLALSVSKWIHLNEGDEGLLAFFRRVASVLRPGGVFVLEPQGWESYAKARRMSPKLRDAANMLKLRPDMFPSVIEGLGFAPREYMGMTGEGAFRRPVEVYRTRVDQHAVETTA